MKRRKVIKQIGLGFSAGLVLPGWLAACKEDEPVPVVGYEGTVAIIGAGAAGLYAADILKAQGIKVVLFEASDRPGGRVRTLKSVDKPSASLIFNSQAQFSSDFPNELGAGQIIGSDSSWGKIVEQLNLSKVDLTASTTNSYFLDGDVATSEVAGADPDFIAAKNFFDGIATYSGSNISVQDAVESAGISPRMYAILNAWIGNKYGTSNGQTSMLALAEGANLLVRDNTILTLADNPMQDALLSRFSKVVVDVESNTQITKIDYTGEKVVLSGVRVSGGEPFSAEVDKVIVTVPLSILKNGGITFSPALPATKIAALEKLDMDAMLRVLIDFKANFWGADTGFIYGGVTSPEYFNSGVGRSTSSGTMAITIGGPQAATLSPLGKDIIPALLSELDSLFGGKATVNVRKDFSDNIIGVVQNWALEPFVQGGVSYPKPGGTNQDRIDLAGAIGNNLFFAGEATDVNGEWGTINGALLSAERVAQEVLDIL